jgi:hypothetical protein
LIYGHRSYFRCLTGTGDGPQPCKATDDTHLATSELAARAVLATGTDTVRYPNDRLGGIKPALVDKSVVLGRLEVKFVEKSRTFDGIVQQSNRAEQVFAPDIA